MGRRNPPRLRGRGRAAAVRFIVNAGEKLFREKVSPPRPRILEIGYGQGDTTAALAAIVGEGGFVHAVDIASPDYGSPETLGQARERLLCGR
ncbi:MAG: hypothetical protein IJ493_01165 [Clostridia bacterium]|nr:hypothetical protein [Clostridia bacterium]